MCEISSISGAVTVYICPRAVVIDCMWPHSCLRDVNPHGDCFSVMGDVVVLCGGQQHDRWLGTVGTEAE